MSKEVVDSIGLFTTCPLARLFLTGYPPPQTVKIGKKSVDSQNIFGHLLAQNLEILKYDRCGKKPGKTTSQHSNTSREVCYSCQTSKRRCHFTNCFEQMKSVMRRERANDHFLVCVAPARDCSIDGYKRCTAFITFACPAELISRNSLQPRADR